MDCMEGIKTPRVNVQFNWARAITKLGGRGKSTSWLRCILSSLIIQIFIIENVINTSSIQLGDSAGSQFVYVLLAETLSVWNVWRVLKHRGLKFNSIGLGRLPNWGDVGKALLGFGAFYLLLIISGILLTQFLPGLDTNQK